MIVAREKTGREEYSGQLPTIRHEIWEQAPRAEKKRRRSKVFKGHKLMLTGLIVAGFLVGCLITYYCSQLFTLGYEISSLNRELAALRVENNNLSEEIQRLSSLDRIEYLAIHKLNMVKPEVNNILVVTAPESPSQESAAAPVAQSGQTAVASSGEQEKSRLIQAFDELVSRLESKRWLGRSQNSCSWEWANANNEYTDAQKNHHTAIFGLSSSVVANLPPGLAAACSRG